jgi:hypothetical protein
VREGEGGGQGGAGGHEVEWGNQVEGLMDVCCASSSKGPPHLYSGEGCTLPLHQGIQEAAAKGKSKGGGGQGRVGCPPETLTLADLGQGLGAPFFISSLTGFFQ